MLSLPTITLLFASLLNPAQAPGAPHPGAVEGIVLDPEGKPLAEATITAYISNSGSRRLVADEQGRFTLKDVAPGSVYLLAEKESEGYPYAFFSFYIAPGQKFPTVNVRPGETLKDVVIQVGTRAARLEVEITDENGKPVEKGANLVFDRTDIPYPSPCYSRGSRAKESLFVPTVPIRLTVQADGFKPWHYGGKDWRTEKGLIHLKSGETLHLSIRLEASQ